MGTTVHSPPTEAEAHPPAAAERRRICRYLQQHRSGALDRCTAESATAPDAPIQMCTRHLAEAMETLVESGAVLPTQSVLEMVEEIVRTERAKQIIQEKVDSGELVRLPSGGLMEAKHYQAMVSERDAMAYVDSPEGVAEIDDLLRSAREATR